MSWRDRLGRRDPVGQLDAKATETEAIGTNGVIGNRTFSAPGDSGSVAEDHRSAHGSSPEVLREAVANSAESAIKSRIIYSDAKLGDAISADNADRSGIHGVPWRDNNEERAAIVEHDGKIPRAWAEGFARLDGFRPPADVPIWRWQIFVDDCGRFLDSGWAKQAAALGWGPFDLFGCDRDRPFARIDSAGLLWILNGDRLVAFTETSATIERRTVKQQIWRRKPSEPGDVLAWEIAR